MKRALRWLGWGLAALLLVVTVAVGYLAGTTSGLRWALGIAQRATAEQLQVGAVEGTLLRGVRLEQIRYDDTGLSLEIQSLAAQWHPAALLQGTVRLRALQVSGVRVQTRPSEPSAEASPFPPQVRLPIGVSVRDAVIEDLAVRQGDQEPLRIDRIALSGGLRGSRLRLRQLQVRGPGLEASAQGQVELDGDYAVDVSAQWALQYRGEQWRGTVTAQGDRDQLRLQHQLEGPVEAQLQAELEDVFDRLRWQAQLQVPPFDADRLLRTVTDPAAEEPLLPLGRLQLNAKLHGDGTRVVLAPVQIRMPDGERELNLRGTVEQWLEARPVADLVLEWQNLQWPLQQPAQVASARGKAQLSGAIEAFRLQVDAALTVPALPDTPARLRLETALRSDGEVLHIEELVARETDSDARVRLQGSVAQWRSASPQFDLRGDWQALQWPLQNSAQVASDRGEFSLEGGTDGYRFRTALALSGPQLPPSQWRITGSGDLERATFERIEADLLQGGLSGDGTLAWAGPLQWQLALQLNQLNPAEIDPAWPGALSGVVRTSGTLPETGPSVQLTLEQLQGTLRQRPFRAEANVALEGQRWEIGRLAVRAGEARFDAKGIYGEQLNLDWQLEASRLADLLPRASGSVHASGSLQGTSEAPRLQAQLRVRGLRWQDYRAESLRGDVQGGVGPGQTLRLDVRGTQLQAGGLAAESVTLTGAGSAEQHQLELQVEQTEGALNVALAGALKPGTVWDGELRQLRLRRDRLGSWQLRQPTPLTLAADQARLERACLQREDAALCVAGRWQQGQGWSGDAQVTELPLAAMAELLPPGTRLTGALNGQATVAVRDGLPSQLDVELNLSPGELRYVVDAQRTLEERFSGGVLRLRQEQAQLLASLQIGLVGEDRIDGDLRVGVPGTAEQGWSASPLQGSLSLRMERLDLIEVFVPQVSNVEGNVRGRLALRGTVGKPDFSGEARVQAPRMELPPLGITLTELDLRAVNAGAGALRLQGSVRSGAGALRLQGRFAAPGEQPWRAELQVEGERFLAARNAEATVYLSPDLRLQAQPKRIDLSGELRVPEAHLTPREGRSAVRASSDVVVVREQQEPAEREAGWAVYAKIALKLGDKVRFTGYGFDGLVSGSLVLNDVPDKITTATGSLTINEASYTAYGRTLKVDRGRLTYSGNPVTNPGLDFVATRTVEQKRVGVLVGGTASNPRLELFSDPNMSEGDILAYLVLGRPLNSAGEADRGTLMAAASSVGLAKGSALAESIGQQLGFEDVGITSEGDTDQPWLTVGRYLSPRLYVSYGVGLFEPGSVVRMRYELTEHWKLQGESGGSSSGGDLLYTIER